MYLAAGEATDWNDHVGGLECIVVVVAKRSRGLKWKTVNAGLRTDMNFF